MKNRQPNSKLKVVIVDDHYLFPLALEALINKYSFLEIAGILSSGTDIVSKMDELQPDIIFMDIAMPIMDGFTATRMITQSHPKTKVVAITAYDEGENVKKMMEAGAWGFIVKDSDKKEYDELFSRIASDKKYISATAAVNYAMFMNEHTNEANYPEPTVTKREIEIIKYVAKGYSDKEIADTLKLSHRTIDAHKQKMMHKLGTRKATEMVAIAYRFKWI